MEDNIIDYSELFERIEEVLREGVPFDRLSDIVPENITAVYAVKEFLANFHCEPLAVQCEEKEMFLKKGVFIFHVLTKLISSHHSSIEETKEFADVIPSERWQDFKELELFSPGSTDKLIEVLEKIIAKDGFSPEGYFDLLDALRCVSFIYFCAGVVGINVSRNILYKIDMSAFSLIFQAGYFCHTWDIATPKIRQRLLTKVSKENHAAETKAKIRAAYEALGVKGYIQDTKRFLVGDKTVTLHKLAGEVFVKLNGEFTQRHIMNCLKALREKGEI